MVNIVIPMAGAGSRFSNAGYSLPKPFIDVNGEPMIVRVLENLTCQAANFILVAQRRHAELFPNLVARLKSEFTVSFILVDELTEGTACTVLQAKELINNQAPLIIANSDQIVDFDINNFINHAEIKNVDGSILAFIDKSKNPKWSYAEVDANGFVQRVVEKCPISEYATVGIYHFRRGSDFVKFASQMLKAQDRVNGEFYTAPVYNYLISEGMAVDTYIINFEDMHGVGTPEDLENYLSNSINVTK